MHGRDRPPRLAADAAELGSFVYDFAGTGAIDWDDRMLDLHGFTGHVRGQALEDNGAAQRLDGAPQLTVPLRASAGVLGAFTVAGSEDQPLDEVLLLDVGSRAAVALENALSFARQDQAATVLQRALLPRTAPAACRSPPATRRPTRRRSPVATSSRPSPSTDGWSAPSET